ncbi:hypothetical protein FSP39_006445 [Pinctada imbricata]|uniref:Sfi1 spindle body domain-containing protein n=1 Tax=Pinctada imbricata TaxID=66713 RepID=A0AA88YFP4_PINIB|nr:hypothetical protein FSP39_006445 [Pinctada imbricata]
MTSIFLERKLPELPTSNRRRLPSVSDVSETREPGATFVINLSPIKKVEEDSAQGQSRKKGQGNKKSSKKTDFKEVRRKLAFTDEEDVSRKIDPLDFTDKMAAFRTLLRNDAKREAERKSEKYGKSESLGTKTAVSSSVKNVNITSTNRDIFKEYLPKSKEARVLLSKLADEELAKMSMKNMEAQLYLQSHGGKNSHQENIKRFSGKLEELVKNTHVEPIEMVPSPNAVITENRNSNANEDDYLAKFLNSGKEDSESAKSKDRTRPKSKKSRDRTSSHGNHDSDSDLDKIPQKESDSQKACSCDIDTKCQRHGPSPQILSETGSVIFEGPGSVRRAANRSIQSNVPHYHPSYPAPRDPPSELLQSSKGANEEGLCRGVRTGEVVITRSGASSKRRPEDLQTIVKKAEGNDKGYLTLEDLAEKGSAKGRRKKSPDKHSRENSKSAEKQIRRNIEELKRDLVISDSSKENSPSLRRKTRQKVGQGNRKVGRGLRIEELVGEDDDVGDERRRGGAVDGGSAKKRVFGPRHPESEAGRSRQRGQGSDVASRISSGSGSVRSLASNSSTVMAVELLRKLYNVDPQQRQDLVLKAKCFRRWLQNVQTMQSIDEHGLDDFPDPLSQTVKQSYVHGSMRADDRYHGNKVARVLESDLETAFSNFSSDFNARQELPSRFVERGRREPVFQVEHIKERATSKVAPITVENLEKHEQYQSNMPVRSNLAVFVNETSRSVFDRVNTPKTPRSLQADIVTSERVEQTQNVARLGTGMKVGQTVKRTIKLGSAQLKDSASTPLGVSPGVSKNVIEKARIARGLGRATNVVPPSIAENIQLLATANYGVCLQSAEIFYRKRLLSAFFLQWKRRAAEQALIKAADTLHRHHTLKKGMEAFKWAINRSRIFIDIFQGKMRGITMANTFYKWRDRALSNRYQRMRTSFTKWQHFTAEAQKVRSLRQSSERRLQSRSFLYWVEVLRLRLKENAAKYHYRCHLLTRTLMAWRWFALQSREKEQRNEVARTLYSERLQRKMFREMVVVHRKFVQAKKYHRIYHLRQVFVSWHQAAGVCKTERERDMKISGDHWERRTLSKYFIHWHEMVLTEKARDASSSRLVRNAFLIWYTKWEYNVKYREEVEARVRHQVLLSSLTCWRENVQVLRKRREAAVVYIQRVLVRHALHGWNKYTKKKKKIGAILTTYTKQRNATIQKQYLLQWISVFTDKLDLQKAKAFWSNTCVRKAVVRWKILCHQRLLQRLLQDSEPSRQRHLLKAMFQRWLDAKSMIETEKVEASESRTILEKSQLGRYFLIWKKEAELRFRIHPMVKRKMHLLLSESFCEWHQLVQHKKECRMNSDVFRQSQLKTLFKAWRHQYELHQIEKSLHQKVLRGHLQRCVTGWRMVIKRKHQAGQFRQRQLVRQMFNHWRDRAVTQLNQRMAAKEIEDWHMCLMKTHFNLWWENAQAQRASRESVIQISEERRANNRLMSAFVTWRMLLRATLVASREHQKMLTRKIMLRVITTWHSYSQRSLKKAVNEFAIRLGLDPPNDGSFSNLNSTVDSGSEDIEKLHMLHDLIDPEDVCGSQSPFVSSAMGTPRNRLFSPALSRVSLDLDRSIPEIDYKPSMSNTSFIDARFEMEHAVKTERLKEIVTTAIKRLRFWPVSTVFDQWREYAIKQRELRYASHQLTQRVCNLELSLAFEQWRSNYVFSSKAKNFRDSGLMHKAFVALQQHRQKMKYKKELSALAYRYHSVTVFRKIFPVWYEKAHDKRHKERVMRLWTTETVEEKLLIPVETTLKGRIQKRNLAKCFSIWQIKFLRIYKIKVAYNRIILKSCIESWHELASVRHQQRVKCENFNKKRLQSQAFKMWCIRKTQLAQVKEKFKVAQGQRLQELFTTWYHWTKGSRQRKLGYRQVLAVTHQHILTRTFTRWHCEFVKLRQVQKWCEQKLVMRILYEWHEVAKREKQIKQKVLKFKVTCYTRLVIRMYKVWHDKYLERLVEHEEHEKTVQRRALQIGKLWRRKAQKSRALRLRQVFLGRQMQSCFSKWKYSFQRNMERENQLRKYVVRKNRNLIGQYLDAWKTALLANQAGRHFNSKLLRTVFTEWRTFAAASRERKMICVVYVKAAEQRMVKSYFHYWSSLSQVQMDIRKHCDLKMQIRVLREWHHYAKRRRQLRVLGELMTQHVNQRILRNVWYTMRQQYYYYQSLNETATKIVHEKNRQLMTVALDRWHSHLNFVIAGHCYQHLLAVRVARQWSRFVAAQKAERKRQHDLNEMATRHYNKSVCVKAFRALHNEVKVKHQLQRHKNRLANKYGKLWKLRVDMMFTAICVESEKILLRAWSTWRVALSKVKATNRVASYNDKKIMTQVFIAWKGLVFKKLNQNARKSGSSIPVPKFSIPTPGADSGFRSSQIPTPMNGNVGRYTRNQRKN